MGLIIGGLFGSLMLLSFSNQTAQIKTLYYHQIGIYAQTENAQHALDQLAAIGITGDTLQKDGHSVVICGLVYSKEESAAIETQLKQAGLPILEKTVEVSGDLEQKTALLKYLEAGES